MLDNMDAAGWGAEALWGILLGILFVGGIGAWVRLWIHIDNARIERVAKALGFQRSGRGYRIAQGRHELSLGASTLTTEKLRDLSRDPELIARTLERSKLYPNLAMENGRLVYATPDPFTDPDEVRGHMRSLVQLADHLSSKSRDTRRALLAQLETSADVQERVAAIKAMAAHYPDDDHATAAIMRARTDPAPEVRFAALIASGGADVTELSRIAFDDRAPAATSNGALTALLRATTGVERTRWVQLAIASPNTSLRKTAMETAIALAGQDEAMRAVVRDSFALFAGDRDTQFAAALVIGADGLGYLDCFLAVHRDAPPSKLVTALRTTLAHAPDTAAKRTVLDRGLASGVDEVVAISIAELTKLQHAFTQHELAEFVQTCGEKTALATANVLGKTPGAASEALLIELLHRSEPSVPIAVLSALSHVGTSVALEPIEQLANTTVDAEVARFGRAAIELIRERQLQIRGGLSITAGPDGGSLSLSDGAGGQLSIPSKTSGQLSLKDDE